MNVERQKLVSEELCEVGDGRFGEQVRDASARRRRVVQRWSVGRIRYGAHGTCRTYLGPSIHTTGNNNAGRELAAARMRLARVEQFEEGYAREPWSETIDAENLVEIVLAIDVHLLDERVEIISVFLRVFVVWSDLA